ncbi:hypothetical protein Hamer_G018312 [Homarus americanus]|uniref:Uncharacterized protein n=1 Tax=Homarus americanus TaxID=6706 RepID=A0A8J5MTF2_HOMAM|nr:hypothetical protein Hamer_G018312 [Homarus americanus]
MVSSVGGEEVVGTGGGGGEEVMVRTGGGGKEVEGTGTGAVAVSGGTQKFCECGEADIGGGRIGSEGDV